MKNKCALAIGLYILIGVSTSCNKTDTKPAAPAPSTSHAGVISQQTKDAVAAMEESYAKVGWPGNKAGKLDIFASPEKRKVVQDTYSIFLKKAAECIHVAANEANGADQIALQGFSKALNKHSVLVEGLGINDIDYELDIVFERIHTVIKDNSDDYKNLIKGALETIIRMEKKHKGKIEYIQSLEEIQSTYLNAESAVKNWKR